MPVLVEPPGRSSASTAAARHRNLFSSHVLKAVKAPIGAVPAEVHVHVFYGEPAALRPRWEVSADGEPAHPFDDFAPFLTVAAAARRAGTPAESLIQQVQRRALLGVETADGVLLLPEWQFDVDGTPLPRLGEVLDHLAVGTRDAWTWAQWLSSTPGAGGLPAWRSLALGGPAADDVVEEARRDGLRWSR